MKWTARDRHPRFADLLKITFNFADMELQDISLVFKLMYEIADSKKKDKASLDAAELGVLKKWNTTDGVFLNGEVKTVDLTNGSFDLSTFNLEMGYYHEFGYGKVVELTADDGSKQRMLLTPYSGGWNSSMLYNQPPNKDNAAILDPYAGFKAGFNFTLNQYDAKYKTTGTWDFNAGVSYLYNFNQIDPGMAHNLEVDLSIGYEF